MLNIENDNVRKHLFEGEFGIEKEALRILKDGTFAKTPHPFPDDKNIVRDFCENQLEINTGVSNSAKEAIEELEFIEKRVRDKIKEDGEYLWNYSNPPYIRNEDDIPVAQFMGVMSEKTVYRNYLSKMYGKYKMTFSGIHVNYSFAESLLIEDFKLSGEDDFREYKDKIYLNLASNYVNNGWLITALLASSPLLDSSFLTKGVLDGTDFIGMASVRCSELGYWNHFVPVFDYSSIKGYSDSIRGFIKEGLISSQTEVYYPVRLKPRGENNLDNLDRMGVNHIELRNIDVNPFAFAGVDIRDLEFMKLLLVYDACIESGEMTKDRQVKACINFKNAAHYDPDVTQIMITDGYVVSLRTAVLRLLDEMDDFFKDLGFDVYETIKFQVDKFANDDSRYAVRIKNEYGDGFVRNGLLKTLS